MQKISRFFRRDSAKFVPMVRVAGRAGGTTIVIKSSALTMMRCHASCHRVSIGKKTPGISLGEIASLPRAEQN